MSWFKRKKSRNSPPVPAPTRAFSCDCCNTNLTSTSGYSLSTREIVRSELYWAVKLGLSKRTGEVFGLAESDFLRQLPETLTMTAGDTTPWAICENCSEYFVFDRNLARFHSVSGTAPADSGPVKPSDCILFAALGWERVWGTWPAPVPRPPAIDSCDLCGKSMYNGEPSLTLNPEHIRDFQAKGFIDRGPSRAPRAGGGWRACQPCMSPLIAKLDRAN
jgi:hypothetical protein